MLRIATHASQAEGMSANQPPGWRSLLSRTRGTAGIANSAGELFVSGLSFPVAPGPLLVVAGLSGGAGASVLAYLIAVTAARESSGPVLVADTGGPTAGLSSHAGVCAPRTLAEISERLAAGEQINGRVWADAQHGLRVLAGAPQFTVPGDREETRRVLTDAQAVHALTVVDAGTLARPVEQATLGLATHVVWVLPATKTGVTHARQVLQRIAPLNQSEVLLARAQHGVRRAPTSALADLADERRAQLVLMPTLDTTSADVSAMVDRAQLALQAIGGVLQR
jgi:Flp pilus assembly CpaE family ATPase